jgi:hypothetical protein
MKKQILLFGVISLCIGQFATADCYLPVKYGKLDRANMVTIEKSQEPEKFQAFVQKISQSTGGAAVLLKASAQALKSAGYGNPQESDNISLFPPTIFTGNRYVYLTNRYYGKVLNQVKGQTTSETVIETHCGTVMVESSGYPKDLSIEGFSIDSSVGTSVPGGTSSAGG